MFPDDSRAKYNNAHQHAPDFIFGILCQHGEECDGYRQELEDLLEAGDRLGLLDGEVAGRLSSLDREGFLSAFAELETGYFLDKHGFQVTPRPAGKGNHIGDLQIQTQPPTFVEVKAALDRSEEAVEGRVIAGLIRYAEPLLDQFKDSVIAEFRVLEGGTFARRHLEHWLRKVFKSRQETGLTGSSADLLYESGQGLRLEVTLHPVDGMETAAIMPTSEKTNPPIAEYFAASIESAHPQLPDDGRPALVVVRPFLSLWATEKHLREALFGKIVWDINFETASYSERHDGDGLLAPGKWSRLSGVGLLDVRRRTVGDKTTKLMILHNPWAPYPLDAAALAGTGIYHFLPKDGKMEWSPSIDEESG